MITTDDLTAGPDLHSDPWAADGAESGRWTAGPAHDLDGDGVLDTQVFEVDDALVVVTDLDGDGDADHITIVGGEGGYAAWEFHRDAEGVERWERTDSGRLGAGQYPDSGNEPTGGDI